MIILLLFAFLGGIITILSPCILPILPIVLSGSLTGGKKRPFGIITGFILSFTLFTLTLTSIVRATGLPSESLRYFAIGVVFIFGISLLLPITQKLLEQLMSRFSGFLPQSKSDAGFGGGVLVGLSLGLVWTPCVGPILASVITLASTSQVTAAAFAITLAYSIGTALPMLAITYGGRQLLQRAPWLLTHSDKLQKGFGVIMIATAAGMFFNLDRAFQTYVLQTFPEYGTGLTALEDNELIQQELDKLDTQNNGNGFINSIKDSFDGLNNYGPAPEITDGTDWVQGEPTSLAELRGNVVLVDFWTYTCINCIRTLPYLNSWHEKYHDQGLEIIGVHSPEFEFEKNADNVKEAIADFDIKHRVVQDNDFKIWRAYNNRYWPAKYLIDAQGNVQYVHFGEGAYDETEKAIQELLKKAGTSNEDLEAAVRNNPDTPQEYTTQTKTPETYIGYWRHASFSSLETVRKDTAFEYSFPTILRSNNWAVAGNWTFNNQHAAAQPGSKLRLQFTAKKVFLVARPTETENGSDSALLQVSLDGNLIQANQAGSTVENGTVTITKDSIYELVDLEEAGSHLLELEVTGETELELYAFTFG